MGIEGLRAKYEEMLRLRLLHEAGDPTDPRRAMARLAQEFPGALREIDELPIAEIRARIDALAEAEKDPTKISPWMLAVHRFHALTRGALCAKSWLGGRKDVTPEAREAFARDAETLCFGDDARAWADDLVRVASPPRGRITDLVFTRIAGELGVDEPSARALVFPRARRGRAARLV